MNRMECYEALFRIKKERGINIDPILNQLGSSERVPQEVLDFIEGNSSRTLEDFLSVISRKKPFFNNICFNYNEDISTYVKAMLSFMTHIVITIDKNPELRGPINQLFDLKEVSRVVSENIIVGGNEEDVLTEARKIKTVYMGAGYK